MGNLLAQLHMKNGRSKRGAGGAFSRMPLEG